MENILFYEKYNLTEQKEGCSLYCCFILLQETKNSNLFDKNCTKENLKRTLNAIIQHEEN